MPLLLVDHAYLNELVVVLSVTVQDCDAAGELFPLGENVTIGGVVKLRMLPYKYVPNVLYLTKAR